MANDKWQIAFEDGDGLSLAIYLVCGKPHSVLMGDAGFRRGADILVFRDRSQSGCGSSKWVLPRRFGNSEGRPREHLSLISILSFRESTI